MYKNLEEGTVQYTAAKVLGLHFGAYYRGNATRRHAEETGSIVRMCTKIKPLSKSCSKRCLAEVHVPVSGVAFISFCRSLRVATS